MPNRCLLRPRLRLWLVVRICQAPFPVKACLTVKLVVLVLLRLGFVSDFPYYIYITHLFIFQLVYSLKIETSHGKDVLSISNLARSTGLVHGYSGARSKLLCSALPTKRRSLQASPA